MRYGLQFCSAFLFSLIMGNSVWAQSLDFPSKDFGISIGNSKNFTGLRLNFRDKGVEKITGINITIWNPKDSESSVIKGLSVGLLAAGGGRLSGISIGGLGVGAEEKLSGFSAGLLGVGSGGDISGIAIGGLGAGAGGDITGFTFGLLGAGAGGSIKGITIGGLGAGAGGNMSGLNIGLLGCGAGKNMTGINIGGLGVGAGEELKGISIALFGAGSPSVKGLTISGFGVGGENIKGITLALGMIKIDSQDYTGQMTGFSASAFNYFKGSLNGVSIGIVNYAYDLNGIQIGLINYVKNNPKGLKILPIINFNFK